MQQQIVKQIGNSFYIDNKLFVYTKVGDMNVWQTLDKTYKIEGTHYPTHVYLDIPIVINDLKTSLINHKPQ